MIAAGIAVLTGLGAGLGIGYLKGSRSHCKTAGGSRRHQ